MRIPRGVKLRFLLAGGFNTAFGVADTLSLTWLFVHLKPTQQALMTSAATVIASVLNITVSFLTYKLFVFQTRGNYVQEYLKSLLVYVPSITIGAIAVAPLAAVFHRTLPRPQFAPYVAQAIVISFTVVMSFLGHKHITFRQKTNA